MLCHGCLSQFILLFLELKVIIFIDYPEASHLLISGKISKAAERAASTATAVQPIMF
jgi:hypothetical protein